MGGKKGGGDGEKGQDVGERGRRVAEVRLNIVTGQEKRLEKKRGLGKCSEGWGWGVGEGR